ncbi:uncharacterized protein PFL1_00323 [Pseudozyma flocculosa PF-1]|uniref:Fumarylacetoacetase n=1 Tax=Pseudozyma flocculosa TaxID=84751 RepID=A0A5C3ETY4_9BASI|nr:uncharacterized protein PFL1_00323 [Pseudozyma flocculosa PF-1]EPQ32126.1 hypothetical protein PFL1_00323 [Pseudozyma flocculosa PF-1]SPO34937.1 related to fumarylacetoacetate hydrolase [Pseudozyma flocculosa]
MPSSPHRLSSFVEYPADSPFPLENLPWSIISTKSDHADKRAAVALGGHVVDLAALTSLHHLFDAQSAHPPPFDAATAARLFAQPTLNDYISLPSATHRAFRSFLQHLFSSHCALLRDDPSARHQVLVPRDDVTLHLPVKVGDYTDFCASREHTINAGRIIFNVDDRPLDENWLQLPIAYHGRSSSVVVSGTPITRPCGISKMRVPGAKPHFGPSKVVDYELEVAFIIGGGTEGKPNDLGEPIPLQEAEQRIFGLLIMNDWSARDIQGYEMVPLGPFAGKNFGTTVSPWIVETSALEPFRVPSPAQDPTPLPHLDQRGEGKQWDISLAVDVKASDSDKWTTTTETNLKYLYWTASQMVVHHAACGCNLNAGDMLGSGTISGPASDPNPAACLLEKTWGGRNAFKLEGGGERTYIQDGDTVRMTAQATRADGLTIGFGDCTGQLVSARHAA